MHPQKMPQRKRQKNNVVAAACKNYYLPRLFSAALNILCALALLSLSSIGSTGAYFNDVEKVQLNYSAATLFFSLSSNNDFSPALTPSQNSARVVNIENLGTADFNFKATSANISGDQDLCSQILIEVKQTEQILYSGFLSDLVAENIYLASGQTADLTFTATFSTDDQQFQNLTCNFDLDFSAWQPDFSGATLGFSDQRTISNLISSGSWTVESSPAIVLNEFLPNPEGDDDAAMPKGEWVELYNLSTAPVEAAGWVLYDNSNIHPLVISTSNSDNNQNPYDEGETVVPPAGFLVVYLDGKYNQGWLNRTSDKVRLYDGPIGSGGQLIDDYNYSGEDFYKLTPTPGSPNVNDSYGSPGSEVLSNKSFARIPDGTGEWVDPVPTPGEPNRLDDSPELNSNKSNETLITNTDANDEENISDDGSGGPLADYCTEQ